MMSIRAASSKMAKVHPLSVQLVRQWQNHARYTTYTRHSDLTSLGMQLAARWNKNLARLYARRMLQLAAASAASYRIKTELEQHIEKPSAWLDWQAKDWEETALASLGKTKLSRFFMAASRVFSLAVLCSPMMVMAPLSYFSDGAKDAAWIYALWGIEQAGPTWIKLVQWATTRQDLFSPEFCQYFGKLRDDTEGHAWKDTEAVLKAELGDNWKNILDLDPTPIGSGCVAQVYRGYLKRAEGPHAAQTKVAIKVQHPGILYKVCIDFYILHKLSKWIEAIPRLNLEYLSISDTIRQFRDIMLPQLDLTLEAIHLKRFNQDFANDDQVDFPVPIDSLTSRELLVETFCEGTPILEYTKPGTPKEEREQLAYLGLRTTLKMIFLNDFLHGDLHPGNILVSGKYPKLVMNLLDCGLVLEMGPEQHINLVKVLGAFTRKNGRLAGQLLVDLKSESQAGPEDMELFIKGIEQICTMDEDQNFIEKVGDYIADICYLACTHRVKLEGAFVNASMAVEIMEGLASALHSDMLVQDVALPMIVKAEVMHRLGIKAY